MHKITFQRSRPGKCLLFGVYFIFFLVQVHLRYAYVPAVTTETTVQTSEDGHFDSAPKDAKPETKLNKRFFPTQIYGPVPSQLDYHLQEVVVVLQKQTLSLTPSLPSTLLTSLSLRGPPVIV